MFHINNKYVSYPLLIPVISFVLSLALMYEQLNFSTLNIFRNRDQITYYYEVFYYVFFLAYVVTLIYDFSAKRQVIKYAALSVIAAIPAYFLLFYFTIMSVDTFHWLENMTVRNTRQPASVQQNIQSPLQQNTQTLQPKIYYSMGDEISFSYPTNFSIVENKIISTAPDGKVWRRVILTDVSVIEEPALIFETNADGYGPFFPDKTYAVYETKEGRIKIIAEVPTDLGDADEYKNDGFTMIIPNGIDSQNSNSYSFRFTFKEGGRNFEPEFKNILQSVQFLNIY
jgi:hypothetical protein